MQDRFKFRMYNTNVNKMYMPNDFEEVESIYECIKQQINWDIDVDYDIKFNHLEDGRFFMQCTGLKDKNGKLIFEGDLVKFRKIYECACFTQEEEVLFKVIWECDGFYLSQIKVIKGNISYITGKRLTAILEKDTYVEYQTDISLEVIGNIYENPELL